MQQDTSAPSKTPLQRRDQCFRVLRPDELEGLKTNGLRAKNTDKKVAKSASFAEHVRNGSNPNYKSPYISLTANIDCACKFAGLFQNIARINLRPLMEGGENSVIDLTNSKNRNEYLKEEDAVFAVRSEEILVLSQVEPQHVSLLSPTLPQLLTSKGFKVPRIESLMSRKTQVTGGSNDGLLRLIPHFADDGPALIAKRPRPNVDTDRLNDWVQLRTQTLQEYVSFQIYLTCGIKVPNCAFLEVEVTWKDESDQGGSECVKQTVKPTVLILDNVILPSATDEENKVKALVERSDEFAQGFVVDCFLGNWHVFGSRMKNITMDGIRANFTRIMGFTTCEDVGKGYPVMPFGNEVLEIEYLRKKAPFTLLSNAQIGQQIVSLLSCRHQLEPFLKLLDQSVQDILSARLEFLRSWLNWNRLEPTMAMAPPARDGHVAFIAKKDSSTLFIFGGNSKNGPVNDVWCFKLKTSEWRQLQDCGEPAPAPRYSCSIACVGVRAFIMGGGVGQKLFNDVLVFNMETGKWETSAWKHTGEIMPALIRHASVAIGNRIYIFGGEINRPNKKGLKRTNQFFIGTVGNKSISWEKFDGQLPLSVHRHTMCADNKRIYLIGGMSNDHVHAFSKLHIFNLKERTWNAVMTNGAAVIQNSCRAGHSAFLWDKELIIFGGGVLSERRGEEHQEAFGPRVVSSLSSSLFALNLETHSWRDLTANLAGSAPVSSSGQSCTLLREPERVIIFGGRGTDDTFFNQCYTLRPGELISLSFNLINYLTFPLKARLMCQHCNESM